MCVTYEQAGKAVNTFMYIPRDAPRGTLGHINAKSCLKIEQL